MVIGIGRRQFISALGGATVAWPLGVRARQPEQMRRIGVLMNRAVEDSEGQASVAAFQQAMQQSGWSDGSDSWRPLYSRRLRQHSLTGASALGR